MHAATSAGDWLRIATAPARPGSAERRETAPRGMWTVLVADSTQNIPFGAAATEPGQQGPSAPIRRIARCLIPDCVGYASR